MSQHHILIVDDEPGVRDVVRRYLERDGHLVSTASTGPEAASILDREAKTLDLVVLDVMLPGIDGLSLLKTLRSKSKLPVIMLSARSDEFDRIRGLDLGADDYIPKPFGPSEVVSRVRAVLRRAPPRDDLVAAESALQIGQIMLDPAQRIVTISGTLVELTAREFELLWFFMRHPRQVFSREQLLDQIWGFNESVDPSTVTVHIHRLRDKLSRQKAGASLATVWGVGYKLTDENG
jgi:DNA-binding response OmpR family regulator